MRQSMLLRRRLASAPSTRVAGLQDLDYMEELLEKIETRGLPAPAPIEQRWTSSSAAPMSPAHSTSPEDMHSWVGVIMYLPTDEPAQRASITEAFEKYAHMCEEEMMGKYGAKWHWAKLEPGGDDERRAWVRKYLAEHYDVGRFNQARRALDPENNLGNDWLNAVLPLTRS
jgi:L-galactono-1,4-lactone dehydrogenase